MRLRRPMLRRPKLKRPKLSNFSYLMLSSSLMALLGGVFGPFYALYIQRVGGGIENFGYAIGLFVIASSVTSYAVGRYSDRLGRKPFMIFSNMASAVLALSYLAIRSVPQLMIVQVLSGMSDSMWFVAKSALMADLTKRKTRGQMIGMYELVVGLLQGSAVLASGLLVNAMGFEIIFYMVFVANIVSTIPLLLIKEK